MTEMEDTIEGHTHDTHPTRSVLVGLLVGGLAGAAAMLLFAPQSGERTRAQIREKGIQLRDQTTATVKNVLEQARLETEEMTAEVREKAGELKQLGQDKLVEQMDRVSAALDAGKKAVKAA
jgi:gas vesicle protein